MLSLEQLRNSLFKSTVPYDTKPPTAYERACEDPDTWVDMQSEERIQVAFARARKELGLEESPREDDEIWPEYEDAVNLYLEMMRLSDQLEGFVRRGICTKHVLPETGEYQYTITEAGQEALREYER